MVCAHPARGDGHREMFVDPPEAVVRDHEPALAGPLVDRLVRLAEMRAVQRRRELPTQVTRLLKLAMQHAMVDSLRADRACIPLPMRLAARLVPVRRVVSRFLALGVRNESVRSRRAVGVEGSNP